MFKGRGSPTQWFGEGGKAWECSRCSKKNWAWVKQCVKCGKRRSKKDKDA